MEVSEYLVGSPAFKAGDTGDPRMAGSIPVHLRHSVLVAVVMTLFVSLPVAVGAQARLLSSAPADGASVQTLESVEFEFDSLLLPDNAEVTATKLDGTVFPVGIARIDRSSMSATIAEPLPSGNYSIGYSVESADGFENVGSIRVTVDAPSQALSGGLLAVIGIFAGLCIYLGLVFRADKRRRPRRS